MSIRPLLLILVTVQRVDEGVSFATCIEKVIQFDFERFMHCDKSHLEDKKKRNSNQIITYCCHN